MTVGENIRQCRKERGMTQKQLGALCGMPDSQVRKYELGVNTPTFDTLKKIASGLKVNPLELAPDFDIPGVYGVHEKKRVCFTWVSVDEQRPQIGSVGIDGFGNYPEVLTTIVELKTESGESLYFTERYLDEVRRSKGSKYELTICKDASIRWWLPLPPRPETNSIETDEDEQ